MNHGPVLAPSGHSGTSPRRTSRPAWIVGTVCLLLAGGWAIAGSAIAQAGAKPAPSAAPAAPAAGRPLPPGEAAEARFWGTVRAVPDGANLVVVTPELERYEVRLLGVEPPELPHPGRPGVRPIEGQPFGLETARYLRDLVMDKQVQLETYGKDRSGRILGVVWLGDINVNLTLVKEGLAWVSPNLSVTKVRVELEVAERQAQVGKYGLWALPNPEPPWEFRKRHHLPSE